MIAAFVVLESRLRNPIMPLRILRLRSLTGASITRSFVFAGMFTNFFVGALYLQHIRGLSAFETGLAFLPTTLVLAALSAGLSARLMVRFGARNLAVAGLVGIGTALLLLSGVDQESSYFPRIFAAYLLFGLGGGLAFMPLLSISMSEVPAADAGLAAGFGNVTMQMGAAIGLAALGAVSTAHAQTLIAQGQTVSEALTGGYQLAFLLAALCVLAGLGVVLMVIRPSGGGARRPSPVELDRAETEAA
jgi:MFS family permease